MKKIFLTAVALFLCATTANAQTTGQFTDRVENREPVSKIEAVNKDSSENITFYSTIIDQQGNTVSHVWKSEGVEVFRKPFNVGAARWRVWSSTASKKFAAGSKATVDVVDGNGNVLYSESIDIVSNTEPVAETPAEEASEIVEEDIVETE